MRKRHKLCRASQWAPPSSAAHPSPSSGFSARNSEGQGSQVWALKQAQREQQMFLWLPCWSWSTMSYWGRMRPCAGRICSPGGNAPQMQTVLMAGMRSPLCKIIGWTRPSCLGLKPPCALVPTGHPLDNQPQVQCPCLACWVPWGARWHRDAPRLRQAPGRSLVFPLGGLWLVTQLPWTLMSHLTNACITGLTLKLNGVLRERCCEEKTNCKSSTHHEAFPSHSGRPVYSSALPPES